MQKWEYKFTDMLTEGEINKLGEQGWELVAVSDYYTHRFVFKRPKR